jgi:Zn-finger nucleic acid-binding protein
MLVMSDRQGIEIDYCPTCRGVWLDRGELDKIIERSAPAPTVSFGGAPRHHDDYRDKRHHKRKSFLSELFD